MKVLSLSRIGPLLREHNLCVEEILYVSATFPFPYFLYFSCSIAAACWSGHFVKRLLETIFIHRFSHATMPLFNLFKVSCFRPNLLALSHPVFCPQRGRGTGSFYQRAAGNCTHAIC